MVYAVIRVALDVFVVLECDSALVGGSLLRTFVIAAGD